MIKKILLLCCFLITPIVSANAVTCNVGEYADGDFCYECPANAECPDGIDFVCDSGWYKNGNICSKCSVENSTCTNGTDYNCLPGFYDENKKCNLCPANATCAGGHEFFYCDAGYFKHISYGVAVQCLSCSNHVCDGETLIRCGDGYYLHSGGTCMSCQKVGQYCPPGEAVVGITCDNGYYKDPNGTCRVCPTGYQCIRGESNSNNMYNYCAPGYYRTGGSCSKCDDGVICPGGKIDEMVCPDGLYKHDDGRCLTYSPGDCGTAPNCNPGCYNAGNTCTKCVANSTCTSAEDFTCNAGYYKNGSKCNMCPSNADCSDGTIKCSPGYWLDSNKKCNSCGDSGQYCHDNVKYQCPGYSDGIFEPVPPEGDLFSTYDYLVTKNRPFSTSITDCIMVRPQFATKEGEYITVQHSYYDGTHYTISTYADKYWVIANTGYYLDTIKMLNGLPYYAYSKACTNGAPNSYYTGAGSPGGNDCPWVCEGGYYRNGNNCFVCPEGMVCEGGKIICPPGMYVDENSNQCMNCPTGYDDNPNRGAQSINECQMWCNGGYYVPVDGYEKCTAVGHGFWREGHFANYKLHDMKYPCRADLTNAGYGAGADEESDCGHELNIGGQKIYMRQDKRTEHALHIKTPAGEIFYSHASPEEIGHVRTLLNGQVLSLYDDITAQESGQPVPEPVSQ